MSVFDEVYSHQLEAEIIIRDKKLSQKDNEIAELNGRLNEANERLSHFEGRLICCKCNAEADRKIVRDLMAKTDYTEQEWYEAAEAFKRLEQLQQSRGGG